jgi:hypothetical protein
MLADRSDDRCATRTRACPRCRPGPARRWNRTALNPPQLLLWAGTALLGVAIAILNVLLPSLIKRGFPTRIGPVTGAYTAVQSGVAALAAGAACHMSGDTMGDGLGRPSGTNVLGECQVARGSAASGVTHMLAFQARPAAW